MHRSKEDRDKLHEQVHRQVKELFHIEDMSGVDLFTSLVRIVQLTEMVENQRAGIPGISSPRWRLLLRLFIAEQMGDKQGLIPTELSHSQRVSKNTISALLRGLEEQGLIQRSVDPTDLRLFRIRLTDSGRQLVMDTAPERIRGLNQMLCGLSAQEVQQLSGLLEKLRRSLEEQLVSD